MKNLPYPISECPCNRCLLDQVDPIDLESVATPEQYQVWIRDQQLRSQPHRCEPSP
jgi:hypothetical protein